jgi:hypothetical protein
MLCEMHAHQHHSHMPFLQHAHRTNELTTEGMSQGVKGAAPQQGAAQVQTHRQQALPQEPCAAMCCSMQCTRATHGRQPGRVTRRAQAPLSRPQFINCISTALKAIASAKASALLEPQHARFLQRTEATTAVADCLSRKPLLLPVVRSCHMLVPLQSHSSAALASVATRLAAAIDILALLLT